MNTLSESMKLKFGSVDGAHIIRKVNLGLNAYETLHLICAELDIDITKYEDSDIDSAAIILGNFCKAANDETGYVVSVWF